MNASSSTTLFILLVALIALSEATKTQGCSKEQSDRRHNCGGTVTEPPQTTTVAAPVTTPSTVPTPPPGLCYCTPSSPAPTGSGPNGNDGHFHSHCILYEAFFSFTGLLNIQQQFYWEEWLVEIQDLYLGNASLSEDQKIVLISYSLKAFFSIHADIYSVLSYQKISSWGFVVDFLYVSINIQLEITQTIVAIGGNGHCELTDALKNRSLSLNSQDQQAINALIIQILAHLNDNTYTYQQQLALVYEEFEAFFSNNPSLQSIVLSLEIEGYGSLQSFLDVCYVFVETTTLSVILSGSSVSDCPLLAALDAASRNTSINASITFQINELKIALTAYFQTTIDISLRLEDCSFEIWKLIQLLPISVKDLQQITIGSWGSVYDLLFCSGICTNYGCGNPNWGKGPQGGSTVAPSTTQKPFKPADCSTCGSLIVVDSNNQTILTNVLVTAYASFTSSQKLGFNSCFNKIRNAIWNTVAFPTAAGRLAECHTDLMQYNNNSVTNQQLVFNLTIPAWQGTIGQFVICTQN